MSVDFYWGFMAGITAIVTVMFIGEITLAKKSKRK